MVGEVPKYPRRILVGETSEPWKEGKGPIGSQLEKGTIENDLRWEWHVPVQETQLRN